MTTDQRAFREKVTACLGKSEGVAALQDCIGGHFPDLEVFRENDDLVVKHGGRFLIVRRVNKDRFRTADYAGPPTTNQVDLGSGAERDVDGLFDDITAFSGV